MICPNCGEDNSSNFKFCGMCGTSLEERRPIGAPRVVSASEAGRAPQSAAESRTVASGTAADHTVPPTTGPSFLGLNQPLSDGQDRNDPILGAPRDQPFFGSDTFFEPDEPNVGARRIVILLVLLAALGAGGWWAFSHYDKIGAVVSTNSGSNSETSTTNPGGTETAANSSAPNANSSTKPPSAPAPTPSQSTAPVGTQSAQPPTTQPPAAQSTTPSAAPVVDEKSANEKSAEQKTADETATQPPPAAAKPAESSHPSRTQNIVHAQRAETRKASPPPRVAPAADDKGNAEFKRGEAYLYGRGMPENCDQAIRNLKEASAKQNAKARSAFGTMYATGHCVPRDLPTSYSWFALALRADPNNQILEKDLVAVWNQMTPPERQMAIKAKQ
ncbi:MAG: zinc-ribbon domain-containing protein [Terriglobales bacterium]